MTDDLPVNYDLIVVGTGKHWRVYTLIYELQENVIHFHVSQGYQKVLWHLQLPE
jgi:hypothetical protein